MQLVRVFEDQISEAIVYTRCCNSLSMFFFQPLLIHFLYLFAAMYVVQIGVLQIPAFCMLSREIQMHISYKAKTLALFFFSVE